MKYVTSDSHLFHENVIKYMHRPFKDLDEMAAAFVQEWNGLVNDEDTVYHLGDFALGTDLDRVKDVINQLKGKMILVVGNHDTPNKIQFYSNFEKIKVTGGVNVDGYLLTHFPVHPYLLEEVTTRSGDLKDTWNIHGHNHRNSLNDPRYFNMCWDVRDKDDGRHILSIAEVKERISKQMEEWDMSAGGTE